MRHFHFFCFVFFTILQVAALLFVAALIAVAAGQYLAGGLGGFGYPRAGLAYGGYRGIGYAGAPLGVGYAGLGHPGYLGGYGARGLVYG